MSDMSKFWEEHLAQARDNENMGETIGLFHGMLIEGDDKIRELEERLAARGELLDSTAARVAELESLIAAAPHGYGCASQKGVLTISGCDCWKSKV